MTCSSDRTIRFWHFVDNSAVGTDKKNIVTKGLHRNAYNKDMSKIIFVKNNDENARYTYDVLKAKPLDKKEDGTRIEN